MSSFPTDQGLAFILCDDFRHEGDGKLSVFGIIGGNVQVAGPIDTNQIALRSLGLCLFFRDGAGYFDMTLQLNGPGNSAVIPQRPAQRVEKKAEGWMNVALKVEPFQGSLGDYNLKVSLRNTEGQEMEYTRAFSITRQTPAVRH